jgi:hypothetical protein
MQHTYFVYTKLQYRYRDDGNVYLGRPAMFFVYIYIYINHASRIRTREHMTPIAWELRTAHLSPPLPGLQQKRKPILEFWSERVGTTRTSSSCMLGRTRPSNMLTTTCTGSPKRYIYIYMTNLLPRCTEICNIICCDKLLYLSIATVTRRCFVRPCHLYNHVY